MTAVVEELIKTFEQLTDSERIEFAMEILKRVNYLDFPPLSDEDLVLNAEELFIELDKQESTYNTFLKARSDRSCTEQIRKISTQ